MYQNNVKKYKFVNALDFTSFYFKTDDYNLNKKNIIIQKIQYIPLMDFLNEFECKMSKNINM